MNAPVEIAFQGMDAQPAVRDTVYRHIASFERRFGPIATGRVVLRSPHNGVAAPGPYEVDIDLTLPGGRNVFIGGGLQRDPRHANLDLAIDDAFKWARTAAL
jgi:ribosome-associated translation inhibitor RaiA